MRITSFDEMISIARQGDPVSIAVGAAHDPEVLKAVDQAQREGMVRATLVGDWPAIEAYAAQTGVDLSGTGRPTPSSRDRSRRPNCWAWPSTVTWASGGGGS
jgi:phosphotransacetylase